MDKDALGVKRKCLNCGGAFFDLRRDPIVCPRCKTVFVPPPLSPAPYVRKNVSAAEPVSESEVENGLDGDSSPIDVDEENPEIEGAEPDRDELPDEQDEDRFSSETE